MRSLVLILIIFYSCRNVTNDNLSESNVLLIDEHSISENNKTKFLKTNLTHFIVKFVLQDSLNGIMKNDHYLLEVEDITKHNLPITLYGYNQKIDKIIRDSLFSLVYDEGTFSNSVLLNSDLKIIRAESFNLREKKKIRILYNKIEHNYVDIVLNIFIDSEWSSIEYLKIKYDTLFNFKIITNKVISIS